MQIGSNSLRQTYSLSFTKVITAITDDYHRRFGGIIGIIIKPRVFIIMRNGRYFETFRFDKIDYLFNSMDVVELRKRLKGM